MALQNLKIKTIQFIIAYSYQINRNDQIVLVMFALFGFLRRLVDGRFGGRLLNGLTLLSGGGLLRRFAPRRLGAMGRRALPALLWNDVPVRRLIASLKQFRSQYLYRIETFSIFFNKIIKTFL